MSDYELNRAIHHIYTNRDRTMEFRAGDFAVLDRFDLTADTPDAI